MGVEAVAKYENTKKLVCLYSFYLESTPEEGAVKLDPRPLHHHHRGPKRKKASRNRLATGSTANIADRNTKQHTATRQNTTQANSRHLQ